METINNRGAVRLFVCGDIVNLSDKSSIIGPLLSHIIKKADFAVGNLEGVELTARQVKSKQPSQFTGTIAHLAEVGFDMMLLANNHITDFGHDQLLNTINLLKKNNLYYLGAGFSWEETYQPVIVQIKSLKFGFLNVCEAQVGQMTNHNQDFGYAWMSYDQLFDDVKHLSKEVDKVVVFVHAGLEHYTLPLPEIRSFYKRISDAGADAVSLINTLMGMAIDIEKRKPVLSIATGGLSGPAVKPVALRMVWQVAKAVNVPIIGLGGIMNAADAIEFLLAGASAIQIGTANFIDPAVTVKFVQGIDEYLEKHGCKSVNEIIGALED